MAGQDYIFEDANEQAEYERLQLIERIFDPYTKAYLEEINLPLGAKCLEIGPGAGSMARWMCERVGPKGSVTALDLNTRYVSRQPPANLRVRQGDVVKESLEEDAYDLIHARYVFIHVHEYDKALTRLVSALKPGGWLLLEEPDFNLAKSETKDEIFAEAFRRVSEAVKKMYLSKSLDPTFGNKLEALLKKNGFSNVSTRRAVWNAVGGSELAEMMKRSACQLQEKYLETGAVTQTDITNYCRFTQDLAQSAVYYGSISSWGQKA